MTLPSFDSDRRNGVPVKSRALILEVRDSDAPKEKLIAWLLVERVEDYLYDENNNLLNAEIRLYWEVIGPGRARHLPGHRYFGGRYSPNGINGASVSLVQESVFLDPPEIRGHRVGTYLMNEIVVWAKQWPEAAVEPVRLDVGQSDDVNKDRRNRFYERFGLVFEYDDPDKRSGQSRPMQARDLVLVESWKQTLREWDVRDYITDLLCGSERMERELQHRQRIIDNLSSEIRGVERKPLRWALQRTWWRVAPYFGLVAFVSSVVGLLMWRG